MIHIKTMITFPIEELNYCLGHPHSTLRVSKRLTDKMGASLRARYCFN